MKTKFILLLFFYSYFIDAQVSTKVKKLAKPLDTISYAESSHIGVSGQESKIYNYFKTLAKTANNDELYYFAKNGSKSLRLYSSQELFKRNDRRFIEIYQYYTQNPLMMDYLAGCVGEKEFITIYLKDEINSAKQIILLRDRILNIKKKGSLEKIQLVQIYDNGYKKITLENIEFYLKEIKKIDTEK